MVRFAILLSLVLVPLAAPAGEGPSLSLDWARQQLGPLDGPALLSLALYPHDDPGLLLSCPGSAYPDALPECRWEAGGDLLDVGGRQVRVALARRFSEHDGMHTVRTSVALVLPGDPNRVLAFLDSSYQSVVDCGTTLLQRRYALKDLDADGTSELCLEEVKETGQGLFHVMDLEAASLPWFPIASGRTLRAFKLQGDTLVEVSAAACPTQPYLPLADTERWDAPLAVRTRPQGLRTRFEQCPLEPSDTCLELTACSGARSGPAGVAEARVPPAPPWGPYGKDGEGKLIGLRARLRLAGQKGTASPVVVLHDPLLLWYEVQNWGAQDLTLWHAGFWTNHLVEMFDAQGKPVPSSTRGRRFRAAFSPDGPRTKNAPWVIKGGGADDTEGRYDLNALFDIGQEGLYFVRVRYRDDLEVDSNVLPVWLVSGEAKAALDGLNGWPKDECDRHERPGAHPGEVAGGETNGYLESRKAILAEHGYSVAWHAQLQRYHLVSGKSK